MILKFAESLIPSKRHRDLYESWKILPLGDLAEMWHYGAGDDSFVSVCIASLLQVVHELDRKKL